MQDNRQYRVKGQDGYFVKLAQAGGVYFVMKVTEHVTQEGLTDYKCLGYARLFGANIAEWTYWAIDPEEAQAEATKEYLLRELIPLTKYWLEASQNSVKFWLNSGDKDLVEFWSIVSREAGRQ